MKHEFDEAIVVETLSLPLYVLPALNTQGYLGKMKINITNQQKNDRND